MFTVTKHYPHSLGLSAVFRQPRAASHCRFLHGYALAVTLVFEAKELDKNNWVIDFGSLKPVKDFLVQMFDHTLLVAFDDPRRETLEALGKVGLADVRLVKSIGCEAFAQLVGHFVVDWLAMSAPDSMDYMMRSVRLRSCTVAEHAGNSATWEND